MNRNVLEKVMHKHTGIPMANIKCYGVYHVHKDKETLQINGHTIVRQGGDIKLLVPSDRKTSSLYREIIIRKGD